MAAAWQRSVVLVAPLATLAIGCGGGGARTVEAPVVPASVATLQSRPDLHPPVVALDRRPATAAPGLIFLSPRMEEAKRDGATHQQGALALDDQGRTRWWHPAPDGAPITDVRVAALPRTAGAHVVAGRGVGRRHRQRRGIIVDETYRTIATVQAGNGRTSTSTSSCSPTAARRS